MKSVSMIVAVLFATVAFAQEPAATPAPTSPAMEQAAPVKAEKANKKAKHHKKMKKEAASETK